MTDKDDKMNVIYNYVVNQHSDIDRIFEWMSRDRCTADLTGDKLMTNVPDGLGLEADIIAENIMHLNNKVYSLENPTKNND